MVPSYRKMQQEEDEKKESNVPTGNKMQQRTKKGTDFLYYYCQQSLEVLQVDSHKKTIEINKS
jgi:hypothetical protein